MDVVLVGDERVVGAELNRLGESATSGLSITNAPQVVEMHEQPVRAVRTKPDASVVVAADLVASGECGAMVSAGSTGGVLASAIFRIGRMEGIARPSIATVIPFPGHPIVLIDSGANAQCKPFHLAEFGVLGAVFACVALGVAKPRVGLLNIGEEEGKGALLHQEAFTLLAAAAPSAGYEFCGNIEGHDLPKGRADVVVCDGFTGNVVLKLAEGTARVVLGELVKALSESENGPEAMTLLAADLAGIKERLNPEGEGGAHLLGVEGICVIAHGASSASSITSAVRQASEAIDAKLLEGIRDSLRIGPDAQTEMALSAGATGTAASGAGSDA